MIAYHGTRYPEFAKRCGLIPVVKPYGCQRGHICLAERPQVAANFGTVFRVDIEGLDVVWEEGEGRFHGAIPPSRLTPLCYRPAPDWEGWSDPSIRGQHKACLV